MLRTHVKAEGASKVLVLVACLLTARLADVEPCLPTPSPSPPRSVRRLSMRGDSADLRDKHVARARRAAEQARLEHLAQAMQSSRIAGGDDKKDLIERTEMQRFSYVVEQEEEGRKIAKQVTVIVPSATPPPASALDKVRAGPSLYSSMLLTRWMIGHIRPGFPATSPLVSFAFPAGTARTLHSAPVAPPPCPRPSPASSPSLPLPRPQATTGRLERPARTTAASFHAPKRISGSFESLADSYVGARSAATAG